MSFAMTKQDETFLERWLVRLEQKVDSNNQMTQQALNESRGAHEQSKYTNGELARVKEDIEKVKEDVARNEVEISKVKGRPINPTNLNEWYKDPHVLRVLTLLSLALLLLVGAATKVDVGKFI